jgi:HSP20 family protein
MSLYYNKGDDLFNTFFGDSKLKFSNHTNSKYNVYTKKNEVGIFIDVLLPGFSKSDIVLNTDGETFTIECKNSNAFNDREYSTQQFSSINNFKRTWNVPKNFDVENMSASYDSGILTLYLPEFKRASSSRTIKIG